MISLPYDSTWHSLSLIWDNDSCKLQLMLQTWPKDTVKSYWVRGAKMLIQHLLHPWITITCWHAMKSIWSQVIRASNQQPYEEQVGCCPYTSFCWRTATSVAKGHARFSTAILCCEEDNLAQEIVLAQCKVFSKKHSSVEQYVSDVMTLDTKTYWYAWIHTSLWTRKRNQ